MQDAAVVRRVALSHIDGMEHDLAYALGHEGAIVRVAEQMREVIDYCRASDDPRVVSRAGQLCGIYLRLVSETIRQVRESHRNPIPVIRTFNQQINVGQAPPGSGMTPDPARLAEIEAADARIRRALVEAINGGPLPPTQTKTVESRPAGDNGNGNGGNGRH